MQLLMPSSQVQAQGVQVTRQEEPHHRRSPDLRKSVVQKTLQHWIVFIFRCVAITFTAVCWLWRLFTLRLRTWLWVTTANMPGKQKKTKTIAAETVSVWCCLFNVQADLCTTFTVSWRPTLNHSGTAERRKPELIIYLWINSNSCLLNIAVENWRCSVISVYALSVYNYSVS